MRWWRIKDQQALAVLNAHPGGANAVRISPDGRWLATFGQDSRVKLWRAANGGRLGAWVTAIGEYEALSAFATRVFERPDETFAEILAPVHEDFRKSGMTESELDGLLEESLRESRAERDQGKNHVQ